MSLFKVKDQWLTTCGQDETFDASSLAVADLNGKGSDQIIVGSHSGYLRVYECVAENSAEIEYTPACLLIETYLEQPILQVAAGRLTSGIKERHIAILHPYKVAVYALSIIEGTVEHGTETRLVLMYDHVLLKSTYQLIVGPFGSVRDRDFLCVQSLDGVLLFFEQETFVLNRSLPTFLLPSPICYVPQTDSFIVFNAEWTLESYSYQALGDSSDRKLNPSWRYNLGEPILDIQNLIMNMRESAIFVLGERNLFCFSEVGLMRFMKRLQFTPMCFHPYFIAEGEKLMVLVVSDTETVLVYEKTVLRWSAHLSLSPVAISRVNFKALKGLIAVLSESGELRCGVLGTEPSLFVAPPLKTKSATHQQNETKLKQLKEEIKYHASAGADLRNSSSTSTDSELKALYKCVLNSDENTCQILLELSTKSSLSDIQISYEATPPICFHAPVQKLPILCDKTMIENQVVLDYNYDIAVPSSCELLVFISYFNSSGLPKVLRQSTNVPDQFIFDSFFSANDASQKTPGVSTIGNLLSVTLNAAQSIALPILFSEFVNDRWEAAGCTDSRVDFMIRSPTGDETPLRFTVSLEEGAKYKIESNSTACLSLGARSLVERYQRHLLSKKLSRSHSGNQPLTYMSHLPVDSFLKVVDKYHGLVTRQKDLETELAELTCQSRAVQKRLLIKLKDKKIDSLRSLESLHEDTHWSILKLSREVETLQQAVKGCSSELHGFLGLLIFLLSLTPHISDEELKDFELATSSTFYNSESQNWLDVTYSALQYILQKSEKSDTFVAKPFENIEEFKQILMQAINRLSKGIAHQILEEQRGVFPILETDNEEELADETSLTAQKPFNSQATGVMKLSPVAETTQPNSLDEIFF
ncbi:unnamed protein product [Bemisia tabaci]|uniref:Protein PTHB1 n=1 Tax=Bemisia tabaci TaxID=7038 RepID=A0A9P0G2N4_BEMTA|nr:unnamed protein product [Bemisia tabaci]